MLPHLSWARIALIFLVYPWGISANFDSPGDVAFDEYGLNVPLASVTGNFSNLPLPSSNQSYFEVSALEGGALTLRDDYFIDDAIEGKTTILPVLSFLLTHTSSHERILFDLGVRRDWENLSPGAVQVIKGFLAGRINMENGDVVDNLAKGGLTPQDINHIILSHLHWDHIGNVDLFPSPSTTFYTGANSRTLLTSGYPQVPDAQFRSDLLPEGRTKFLDTSEWPPIGPFAHGLDFYEDGSLYIIDAAGHLPGHLNVLARTSSDGGWVYLAGDSAHMRSLITGASHIKVGAPWDPNYCIHEDKQGAEDVIRRIKVLMESEPRVRVLLAHDTPFYESYHPAAFFPNKLESL